MNLLLTLLRCFRREIGIAGESEGVFVLPLGANGEVLKQPVLVSIGTQKGTAEVQLGEVFSEAYKVDANEIEEREHE